METPTAPRFEGLLAEAGRLLASSLELDQTLRTVARLAIPELADWCAVDVVEGDGPPRQIASGHPDPRVDALMLELRRRHREKAVPTPSAGALAVMATGEPAIYAALRPDELPDASPAERELYAQVAPVSWLVAPLVVDGRSVGAISFLSTDPDRVYSEQDVPVAVELAERCAMAVRNAQLYEESEAARSLLGTVFAAAPVGMGLIDADLRYVLLNERLAAINGRPLADHLGRTVPELLGEEAEPAVALLRRVLDDAAPVEDIEILAEGRAFLASYAPIVVDGRAIGVVAAVVDTTDRHRVQEEVARSEARFRALADAAMFGVARGRYELILQANDAFLRMLGRSREELAGDLTWTAITPERWRALDASKARELAETGSFDPYEKEFLRGDGTVVPVLVAASAVPGESGEWMGFCVDLTERRAADRERERLLERTRRLQAVTERLSGSLTAGEVARVIIQEGMAATGASCGVLGMRVEDGLSVEHREGISGRAPGFLPIDAEAPMPAAARARQPVVLASRAAWLERFPGAPPRGDFEAFAAIPLIFEDQVAGVLGLGFPDAGARRPGDVEALQSITRQGALALERARLYEERAYVARTLQAGLLPRALPAVEGLDLAVRYRPIGEGAEVGGDFYDLVELPGGGWLAVVGDICGKGTAAAVLTGVMRSTVRALALSGHGAAGVLHGVNEALLHEDSPQALATMCCAALTRDGDGWAVDVVAGGHPPALVLRAGGEVEEDGARGTLLGMQRTLTLRPSSGRLAPGDTLLLYTDGIIDARPVAGRPFGEERLRDALAAGAGRQSDGVLAVVDAAVRAYAPGTPRDDKALLAIQAAR